MRPLLAGLLLALACARAGAESFEAWSAKAEKAQKAGQAALAMDYWDNALRVWASSDGRKKRARALAARASLREKAGRLEDAAKDLDDALKLDPKKPAYFDQRGQVQAARGKLEDAISDFYSATKLNIDFGPAYAHRASAYERQGELPFAKEDYKTACRLGVKTACAAAKGIAVKKETAKAPIAVPPVDEPKPAASVQLRSTDADEPAEKPAAPKAKPRPMAPVDLEACRGSVEACNEDGNSFTVCLRRAKRCLAKPEKGCCPRACLQEFERKTSEDKSDAELFREIFGANGSCKRLIGAK